MVAYRVMVVVEDPSLRRTIVSLAKQWNFEVFPAADGLDALRQIYHVLPHVVVSDNELVSYAGFELLPFLRHRFPEIGVIVVERKLVPGDDSHHTIADKIVALDLLNPELLGSSLLDLASGFPLRQEREPEDSSASASGQHVSSPELELAPLAKAAWTMLMQRRR